MWPFETQGTYHNQDQTSRVACKADLGDDKFNCLKTGSTECFLSIPRCAGAWGDAMRSRDESSFVWCGFWCGLWEISMSWVTPDSPGFSHSSNQTAKKSSDIRRLEGQSVLCQHHQRQAIARRKEIKSGLEARLSEVVSRLGDSAGYTSSTGSVLLIEASIDS